MKLSEIAEHLGGQLQGDGDCAITSVASLERASQNDISFLADSKYISKLKESNAGAVLVSQDNDVDETGNFIFVQDVSDALGTLLNLFSPEPDHAENGIHQTAVVSSKATLGQDVAIGPNVVIGAHAKIGDGCILNSGVIIGQGVQLGNHCILAPNVVIQQNCQLGNNVKVHPNSTIGADGFGYRFVDGKHQKIPHIGIVVIEDDVEIGANTCIDRAKFGQTRIGIGTKIDNLVQIAHNVQIGNHCVLVSQVGIAGSCQLGNYVVLGGQTGLKDHVKIGDGVQAGGQSGIIKDIAAGMIVWGTPARDMNQVLREQAMVKKLPKLIQDVKKINNK